MWKSLLVSERSTYILRRVQWVFHKTVNKKYPSTEFFFSPYFPTFRLITETYRLNLRIRFEFGKIRTRNNPVFGHFTAQKMKFSIKDLFSKCDQIRSLLRIRSHLLMKSLMENFIFYAVLFKQWNDFWMEFIVKKMKFHLNLLKHIVCLNTLYTY